MCIRDSIGFVGGDKNGGNVHRKMWIMWISGKSNRFFVQLARFTIMYKDFVELWCLHDGGRAGAREEMCIRDRWSSMCH